MASSAIEDLGNAAYGGARLLVLSDEDKNVQAVASLLDWTGGFYLNYLGANEGGGLGTEAMREIISLAVDYDAGLKWQSTPAAVGFYEKMGFGHFFQPMGNIFEVPPDYLYDWIHEGVGAMVKEYGDEPWHGIFAVSPEIMARAVGMQFGANAVGEPVNGVFAASPEIVERALIDES